MKKIKVNLTWDLSTDSSFVKNQTVQVGAEKQVLDPTTTTFYFFEAENTPFQVSLVASTDKNSSTPFVFSGTTPAIADVIVPAAPTNGNVSYEVVDV